MQFIKSIYRKTDFILFILIFTVLVGIVVITLRSKTYSVGYEIAKLKKEEKHLRQRKIELKTQLTSLQKHIRDMYIQKARESGHHPLFFPERDHVIYLQSMGLK